MKAPKNWPLAGAAQTWQILPQDGFSLSIFIVGPASWDPVTSRWLTALVESMAGFCKAILGHSHGAGGDHVSNISLVAYIAAYMNVIYHNVIVMMSSIVDNCTCWPMCILSASVMQIMQISLVILYHLNHWARDTYHLSVTAARHIPVPTPSYTIKGKVHCKELWWATVRSL